MCFFVFPFLVDFFLCARIGNSGGDEERWAHAIFLRALWFHKLHSLDGLLFDLQNQYLPLCKSFIFHSILILKLKDCFNCNFLWFLFCFQICSAIGAFLSASEIVIYALYRHKVKTCKVKSAWEMEEFTSIVNSINASNITNVWIFWIRFFYL